MNTMRSIKKVLLLLCVVVQAFFLFTASLPVHAADADKLWLRAKLTYEMDEGLSGITDDIVKFSSGMWERNGEWYYYKEPVRSGDTIRFIDGVNLPADWTKEQSEKKFNIIVTVQVSEVVPGDTGWNQNSDIAFAQSFDVWKHTFKTAEDVYVKEGNISVSIKEYELDKSGRKVQYQNDKVITPGQPVSKIVEFTIFGEQGGLVNIVPENPVKTVTENGQNVDGKKVSDGASLMYTISMKNPAPTNQTVTITDTVDNRLTITNAGGGEVIGNMISWKITIPAGETGSVYFVASAPTGVTNSTTIPNTASALIVGKTVRSNTVIVSLGPSSALTPLVQLITRQTGDSSVVPFYLGVIGAVLIVLIIFIISIVRRRRQRYYD